jgi:hypothetical protein
MLTGEGELTETRDDLVGVLESQITHTLLIRLSGSHGTKRYAKALHSFMGYLGCICRMTMNIDDMSKDLLVGQRGHLI